MGSADAARCANYLKTRARIPRTWRAIGASQGRPENGDHLAHLTCRLKRGCGFNITPMWGWVSQQQGH
jgi:hypothetical protein